MNHHLVHGSWFRNWFRPGSLPRKALRRFRPFGAGTIRRDRLLAPMEASSPCRTGALGLPGPCWGSGSAGTILRLFRFRLNHVLRRASAVALWRDRRPLCYHPPQEALAGASLPCFSLPAPPVFVSPLEAPFSFYWSFHFQRFICSVPRGTFFTVCFSTFFNPALCLETFNGFLLEKLKKKSSALLGRARQAIWGVRFHFFLLPCLMFHVEH